MFWKAAKTTMMTATIKRIAFSHECSGYKDDDYLIPLEKIQRSMFSVLLTNAENEALILYIDANEHHAMRLVKEGDSIKLELSSLFKPGAMVQDRKCVKSVEIVGPF